MKAKKQYMYSPMVGDDEVELTHPDVYADATRALRAEVYALLVREIDKAWHGSLDALKNLESSLMYEIAVQCRVTLHLDLIHDACYYYEQHRKPHPAVFPTLGPYTVE